MKELVVVAGGGIGGLAAALALGRAGVAVELLEQASAWSEVGAGLQLGPNAVRVLDAWGLADGLRDCAAFPQSLCVRDAQSGATLGSLRLGERALKRYGQPYATLHRADLHALLLRAVQREAGVRLHTATRVSAFEASSDRVRVSGESAQRWEATALIGCDGLWSRVREQLLGAQPVRASGHLAYRGLVRSADLAPALRHNRVTAWLGPRQHVVHYPVRQGEWTNLVAVVHGELGQGHGGPPGSDPQSWSHQAQGADLNRALGSTCADLQDMLGAVTDWKIWALHDRAPMRGAHEQAQGRIALLGDAAHPLRPYLAQGAAMALEDAWTLGQLVQQQQPTHPAGRSSAPALPWPELLDRYARSRWQRNARVQARSARNGTVFHASGLLRLGRNTAMATLGERLLDLPWLYSGPPQPSTTP